MEKRRKFSQIGKSEDGAILAIWGVSFFIFFGLIAMSFDLGRVGVTQRELQSYADNVALTAAGELDGAPGAIARATSAAANMISDMQTYGTGGQGLSSADYTLTFLNDLPASDTAATTAVTTNDADARYVRVDVNNHSVDLTFAAAFSGLSGTTPPANTVNAKAVAGYTSFACDITPMFFCLPNSGYKAKNHIGETILLRSRGAGTGWGPGDFGFLDMTAVGADPNGICAGLTGANLYRCLMGGEGPLTQCYSQRGVDLEPGQKVGLANAAYNVRFDIYNGPINSNSSIYTAAPNVITQFIPSTGPGNACFQNNPPVDPTQLTNMPPDDCMPGCGRYGDGNWSVGRANYEAVNYNGTPPANTVGLSLTRYEYYKLEIAAAGGVNGTNPILPAGKPGGVTGRPRCSANPSNDIDRRTFIAAGIDCSNIPSFSGAATGIPVLEFFKLFMLSPATDNGASPPTVDIYAEIVDSAGGAGIGGTNGVFRDFVQLYR